MIPLFLSPDSALAFQFPVIKNLLLSPKYHMPSQGPSPKARSGAAPTHPQWGPQAKRMPRLSSQPRLRRITTTPPLLFCRETGSESRGLGASAVGGVTSLSGKPKAWLPLLPAKETTSSQCCYSVRPVGGIWRSGLGMPGAHLLTFPTSPQRLSFRPCPLQIPRQGS